MSPSSRHLECSGGYSEKESSYTINEGGVTARCAITHLHPIPVDSRPAQLVSSSYLLANMTGSPCYCPVVEDCGSCVDGKKKLPVLFSCS